MVGVDTAVATDLVSLEDVIGVDQACLSWAAHHSQLHLLLHEVVGYLCLLRVH